MAKNYMTVRRKLAIATWARPTEGNIYGKMVVDVGEALDYLAWLREARGEKVTLTHLVGKAIGMALASAPMVNGRIVLGRYVPFETTAVSFLVALEDGKNLAKAKVDFIDQKSVDTIARELRESVTKLRDGKDEDFKKAMGPIKLLPTWIIRPVIYWTGLMASAFGWSIPALGVHPFPFGSCILTNVGVFGLDEGFAPPTPFARTPVLVLMGAVRDGVVAVDGEVCIRKELTITATIDHRFMDGAQGAKLATVTRKVLADPWMALEGKSRAELTGVAEPV